MNEQAVVIRGTLSDGFKIIGPFKNWDEASLWSEDHPGLLPDWIASITNPQLIVD